jgi:Holliday junction DNA helicase RuvA
VIAGIHGKLLSKTGDRVTVLTPAGVSYELAVPLGVMERLPAEGKSVELQTVLVVREDAWALFGFDEGQERRIFQRLLGASGVGPRLALALLSTLGGLRLARAIQEGDLGVLCTVPGVGRKTAERIVVELRDKLKDIAATEGAEGVLPAEQAVQALVNLGYGAADADRAVREALSQDGSREPVDLIRGALQLLTKSR